MISVDPGFSTANLAPDDSTPDYDMHCPLMGQRRLNYYRRSCQMRQSNPQMSRYCYPECKMK